MAIFKEEVYQSVDKIPRGKVATYGQVIKQLKIDARMVGWMLHQNRDLKVPCHRVVDRNGRLAPNFGGPSLKSFGRRVDPSKLSLTRRSGGFGGWKEQRRRLLLEGVKFVNKTHVDLQKSLYHPS